MSSSTWPLLLLLAGLASCSQDVNQLHREHIKDSCPSADSLLSEPNHVQFLRKDALNSSSHKKHEVSRSPQLQKLLAGLPPLPTLGSSGECGRQSRAVHQAAMELDLWALEMYDSSAKIPSGILNGNVNQLGDFDQCVGVEHDNIQGKYCLAYLNIRLRGEHQQHPGLARALQLAHSYDTIRSNATDPGHRIPRYSSVNWAVCVPAACSAHDVELGLRETLLAPLSIVPEVSVDVRVDPQMCSVREGFNFDTGTVLTITLFATIIGLAFIATIIDRPVASASKQNDEHGRLRRCVMAFSVRRTWHQLTSYSAPPDDVSSVHGVRFLNAFGLLLCHKSMVLFFDPFVNRTTMVERLTMPWTVLGRTAIIYTDAFVLISGMLAAYALVKELDRNKGRIDVRSKYIARFIRITPNFVAIVLFCTFILQMVGSGPQFNLVVKHYSDMCKSHMWKNFLFIHNFFGFEEMCLTHTHQLGIDMQLYLFSPLAVYLLWRWPRAGLAALTTIAAASTWLRYVVTYEKQLSSLVYFGISVQTMFKTSKYSYILPTHRATVYIIGLIFGYYMRRNPNGPNLSKAGTVVCWILFGVTTWYPWLGQYPTTSRHYQYDAVVAARYTAFYPIVWGMFIILFILLGHKDRGGLLGKFIRWKGFLVFTRLSYAVYLTQFPIFFFNVGTRRHAGYSSVLDLLNVSEYGAVIAASVVLTLLVDLPFQEIKKIVSEKKINREESGVTSAATVRQLASSVSCPSDEPDEKRSHVALRRINSTRG